MRIPPSLVRCAGVAALLAASLAPTACRRSGDSGQHAASATKTIGVTLLTREDEFYRQLEAGLQKAAAAHGYKLIVQSGDRDLAKQQSQIDNFIVQGVDAIVVCPVDSKGIGPAIDRANAKNIPVFTADIAAQEGQVVSHVASDNVAGGRLAAEYIAKVIGDKGDVGVIGENDVQSTIDRQKGFQDALAAHPGIKLVAMVDGAGTRDRCAQSGGRSSSGAPDGERDLRHQRRICAGGSTVQRPVAPQRQARDRRLRRDSRGGKGHPRGIAAQSRRRSAAAGDWRRDDRRNRGSFRWEAARARHRGPCSNRGCGFAQGRSVSRAGRSAAALNLSEASGAPIVVELVAESLVKRYPGVVALDGVSLTVKGGEVHAVAGENGAGKSTLMRVLSGATSPDAGAIRIDGRVVRLDSPHDAHSFGIRMIHQELSLVPELSVAENVTLGGEPARWGIVNRARQQREARAVLDRLGQRGLDVTARIEALPLAARQMAEIAKAVIAQARVLIMDEPTAILSGEEADALFSVVRQLRADGVAIVYISHRLEEVFRIADRVTVLRDGRLVSSAPVRETTRADIVRQMVGRELAVGYPPPAAASGDALMRVDRDLLGACPRRLPDGPSRRDSRDRWAGGIG